MDKNQITMRMIESLLVDLPAGELVIVIIKCVKQMNGLTGNFAVKDITPEYLRSLAKEIGIDELFLEQDTDSKDKSPVLVAKSKIQEQIPIQQLRGRVNRPERPVPVITEIRDDFMRKSFEYGGRTFMPLGTIPKDQSGGTTNSMCKPLSNPINGYSYQDFKKAAKVVGIDAIWTDIFEMTYGNTKSFVMPSVTVIFLYNGPINR